MVKVICECGREMEPSTLENGEPDYSFPVAKLEFMGRQQFRGGGLWYLCSNPNCATLNRSVIVMDMDLLVVDTVRYG